MNKRTRLLIILIVFLAVLLSAGLFYQNLADNYADPSLAQQATAPADSEDAQIAPDFTVMDLDGNTVNLHDFIGKPIIVNFWASWCGPCKSEMPALESAYQTYGDEIHFLIINLTDGSRETVDSARDYITGQGYTFPIYFDTDLSATITYGASSIPLTYFIDAAGSPIARHTGALTEDLLQQGIDMIR